MYNLGLSECDRVDACMKGYSMVRLKLEISCIVCKPSPVLLIRRDNKDDLG